MRKSFTKVLSLALATAMTVGLGSGFVAPAHVDASATLKATDNKEIKAFMESGVYNAYLGFQTSSYSYRDGFDNDTTGITNTSIPRDDIKRTFVYESDEKMNLDAPDTDTYDNSGVSVFNWRKMFIQNTPNANSNLINSQFRDLDGDGALDKYKVPKHCKYVVRTADFRQPDITYDGTYTVSMEKFNENTFQYDFGFRMLYINTNIPLSKKDVKFTNIILKIDGVQVGQTMAEGVVRNSGDSPNSYNIMLTNEYGYDSKAPYGQKDAKEDTTKNDAVPDPIWEAAKTNGGVITMPKKSIEITFTVSGLGAAPAGYVAKNDDAIATQTAIDVGNQQTELANKAASEAALSSLAKGSKITAGNLTYKVTKASKVNDGSAEVTVVGVKKAAKKKASLSVPKTIVNEKVKYKVTAINKKAFANCKKLKSITIGANVKKIQKQAFANCAKLAKIKVNGKLTKVEKKAFAGCKKNIKVSGKNKKANIKALKKSGYKKFK